MEAILPVRQAGVEGHAPLSVRDDELLVGSANPVLRNPLMQMTAADFQICRITPDGRISVIDAILHVKGSSRDAAGNVWSKISSPVEFARTGISVEYHQFPGARQRKTPVATFNEDL